MCRKHCSTEGACPFAFSEESEIVQNYGCLPTPMQIMQMRVQHGKTWACHGEPTKPCLGALRFMKQKQIDCTVIDNELVTEDSDWHLLCDENKEAYEWLDKKIKQL